MHRSAWLLPILIVGAWKATARAGDDSLVPSITVVGHGEVQAVPDVAHVTVGVTTEAKTASEAVKQNNDRMAELMKTLGGLNVADKHIQTSNFNVSPKQTFDRDGQHPPKIVGYQVTNQVTVKVVEVGRLGAILDAVVAAGSNQIHGVGFSLSEPTSHLDQARRKAMADARRRAELYAGEAGLKLGKPQLINEQTESLPRPFPMAARGLAVQAEAVPVAAGEQSLSARVTVTYKVSE